MRLWTIGWLALLTSFLAACGDGGSTSDMLNVFVQPVAGNVVDGQERPAFPDEAQSLWISVTGDDDPWGRRIEVPISMRRATLPSFGYGPGRQVTVRVVAHDDVAGDVVVSRGRTVPRKILSGDAARSVNVFVSPTNSFSRPITPPEPGNDPQPALIGVPERVGATATLLFDGRILIAGGGSPSVTGGPGLTGPADLASVRADAEIFDPEIGMFAPVEEMKTARAFHQAVRLPDGRVALIGGFESVAGAIKPSNSVELFDPAGGAFAATTDLPGGAGRAMFTAALASAGSDVIFLAGGYADPAIASGYWDLYVPDVGAVGHGMLAGERARWNHTMTFLPGYRATTGNPGSPAFVLVGGEDVGGVVDYSEAYTGPIQTPDGLQMVLDEGAAGGIPGGGRTLHSSVFVPLQRIVYVIGGFTQKGLKAPTDRVDIFWEEHGAFNASLSLTCDGGCPGEARGAATAVLMDGNAILIAGGYGANGQPLSTTEVVMETVQTDPVSGDQYYTPVVVADRTPSMIAARYGHLALFDATRRVFMVGGLASPGTPVPQDVSAVYYNPE
ncbi:MAG: hypothetical protein FJ087_19210 [Deltaproteobacteria bacterium]|nr:hypothetical protein [Deltaproteobacteria bacterium]